jgi:hypothetical protein
MLMREVEGFVVAVGERRVVERALEAVTGDREEVPHRRVDT